MTRPRRKWMSLALAAAGFACFALSMAIDVGLDGPTAADPGALAAAVALTSTGLLLLACALAATSREDPRQALGLVRPRIAPHAIAALALGLLGLSQLLDLLLTQLALMDGSQLAALRQTTALVRTTPGISTGLTLVALTVFPAVAEELLFRGWLLRALRTVVRPSAAVACSALLFGSLHGEWTHGAAAATLGIYLGVVALAAQSVWPAVYCHLANNALAFAASVDGGRAVGAIDVRLVALASVLALACGVATLVSIVRSQAARNSCAPVAAGEH